ncbi:MAG TPA: dihydrofolate reductase family protein [Solirubrobacteraceae bacterium]|nr:dihydrofolate reductase family protein [Solirubrobacteraceae bacterium]
MGNIVVSEFISVDGVIEDPGGAEGFAHGGWSGKFSSGPEGGKFKYEELMAAEALLLGRVTYQGFAAAWPHIEGTGEFGEKMNGLPKYVVSSTLESADWNNSTILEGDLAAEARGLKDRLGGDILVFGSAKLVQGLIEDDLVDEYRLMVHPVLLGSGKRLFGESEQPSDLQLVDATKAGETVILTFHPARAT